MFSRQFFASLFLVFGFSTLVSFGFQAGRLDRIPDSELDSIFGAAPECTPFELGMQGPRCFGSTQETSCVMATGDVICTDATFKCPLDCPSTITVFPYPQGMTMNAFPLTNCPDGKQAQCIASGVIGMPCKCATAAGQILNKPCADQYRPVCGT